MSHKRIRLSAVATARRWDCPAEGHADHRNFRVANPNGANIASSSAFTKGPSSGTESLGLYFLECLNVLAVALPPASMACA